MNSKTLAIVRGAVRRYIDEPVANYWPDAELNQYISDRELDLWARILAIKKDYWLAPNGTVVTLVIGQYIYAMPSDFWRITATRITTPSQQDITTRFADPNSMEFQQGLRTDIAVSNPSEFLLAVRNMGSLWVSPIPQAPFTMQVDYIQQPTTQVNDSDTFLIPDAFMSFVQLGAASDALLKGPVGDPASWDARAERAWNRIMEAIDTPRQDQGPDVVIGMFDGAIG